MTRAWERIDSDRSFQRHIVIAWLFGTASIFPVASSQAYDPKAGHRYIVDQGFQTLNSVEPGAYDEAKSLLVIIQEGAENEDGSWETDSYGLRGPLHFFNPVTQLPLKVNGTVVSPLKATDVAALDWQSAVEAYRSGDKQAAYWYLGRTAHLVSADLFQPAHTHDDPHTSHVIGGDEETIEIDFGASVHQIDAYPKLPPTFYSATSPLDGIGVRTIGATSALQTYLDSRFDGTVASTRRIRQPSVEMKLIAY